MTKNLLSARGFAQLRSRTSDERHGFFSVSGAAPSAAAVWNGPGSAAVVRAFMESIHAPRARGVRS